MFRRFHEDNKTTKTQKHGTNQEQFYLIRWSDKPGFNIVQARNIRSSSKSILVYEPYTVEFDGKERKGTVILIGTKQECEKHQANLMPKLYAAAPPPSSPREKKTEKRESRTASSSASEILADVKEEPKKDNDEEDEDAVRDAVLQKLLELVISNDKGNDDNDAGETHNVRCAACGTAPISSDRYKCLNCEDLDLCGHCFEGRREPKKHKSGHVFVHYKSPGELFGQPVTEDEVTFAKLKQIYGDEIHESVTCDGCKSESIKGLRFKCDSCPDYDLCQKCVDENVTSKVHKSSHPLIVVRRAFNQIPVEDIQLGEEIGAGAFGTVHKARWLSKNRTVACKVITISNTKQAELLQKSFLKEIAAYIELSGAYILKTYGFAAARQGQNKIFMLITEYMSCGSLSDVIQHGGERISLRRKVDMAKNIASGIRKIHEHGMIHRDIRPDNILVNENFVAKIGDMGIARVVDPLNQHTQIGCQSYMPPEFYQGDYNQKLDIFTFGLTINQLFTGTKHSFQPFVSSDKIAFQEKSPIFDDLIARCTAHDPKRRPAAIEIEKTLDLYSIGFGELVLKKHPSYAKLSTQDRDEIFIAFYQKFHPPATEFIRKEFPSEFLDDHTNIPGVKVDKSAAEGMRIECRMQ